MFKYVSRLTMVVLVGLFLFIVGASPALADDPPPPPDPPGIVINRSGTERGKTAPKQLNATELGRLRRPQSLEVAQAGVGAYAAATYDVNWNVKTTFTVGEPINYLGWAYNTTGVNQSIYIWFFRSTPCGSGYLSEGWVTAAPGYPAWYTSANAACPGGQQFVFWVYSQGVYSSQTINYTVNPQSGPSGFVFCANEGQRCNFSGTKDVAFGANGKFFYRYNVTGGIDCNNATFGDPIPGVTKACYTRDSQNVPPPGYTFCVVEGQRCSFAGTRDVAYGAQGKFFYRYNVTGGIDCNNATFGDPISGVTKACYTKASSNVLKVVLDPGHGWCTGTPGPYCPVDTGGQGYGMKEKDVALDIAKRVKPILEAEGIQVYLTRTGDDPNHNLSYAVQFVNQINPNVAVSIHTNSGGRRGVEGCYQGNKSTTAQSKNLATQLVNYISGDLTLRNRGVFSEYNLYHCGRGNPLYIHDMNPVASLVLAAFIDNQYDANKLLNRRQDFADAIADAILTSLGL